MAPCHRALWCRNLGHLRHLPQPRSWRPGKGMKTGSRLVSWRRCLDVGKGSARNAMWKIQHSRALLGALAPACMLCWSLHMTENESLRSIWPHLRYHQQNCKSRGWAGVDFPKRRLLRWRASARSVAEVEGIALHSGAISCGRGTRITIPRNPSSRMHVNAIRYRYCTIWHLRAMLL